MHFRRLLSLVFLLLCALVAGCDQAALLDKLASQEDQAFARSQVERLRAREFAAIEQVLDKRIATPQVRGSLEAMAGMVPPRAPLSVKIVGAQKHYGSGVTTLHSSYEYEFTDRWLLVQLSVVEQGGNRTITAFNVYPRNQSLEQENRFTLAGKGASHYIMLVAAFVSVALSLAALAVCLRTRPRRKWLWIVFILLGFCRFTVNWNTGVVVFQPLWLQLFGASAVAQLGAPWMVSVSIPLGAIVFLVVAARKQEALDVAGANGSGTAR